MSKSQLKRIAIQNGEQPPADEIPAWVAPYYQWQSGNLRRADYQVRNGFEAGWNAAMEYLIGKDRK